MHWAISLGWCVCLGQCRGFCNLILAYVISKIGCLHFSRHFDSSIFFTVFKCKQQHFNTFMGPFLSKKFCFLAPTPFFSQSPTPHTHRVQISALIFLAALGNGWTCRNWNSKGTISCKWGTDIYKMYELWSKKSLATRTCSLKHGIS